MVKHRRNKDIQQLIAGLVLLVVINLLSTGYFTRFDFTSEKRYTLAPVTKSMLANLEQTINITVFLEGNEFPSGFKRLKSSTVDILSDFNAYAKVKLNISFINPLADAGMDEQQEIIEHLQQQGIVATNLSVKTANGLSQKLIFPAAMVNYGEQYIPVQLLQTRIGLSPEEVLNNSIQNLEYAFASAIKKSITTGKPRIGFTEGHGELSDLQLQDAMYSLEGAYEVGRVDLATIPFSGLEKLKVLIIPKPDQQFTELEKLKIDQFLMRGGSVLWSVDQVNAELDSMRGKGGDQLAFPKKLNIDDQLFRYGVRINYDLIADMNCAQVPVSTGNIAGQSQIQLVPWLFYPVFIPISKHPIVKNLDAIRSEFASTIDLLETKGTNKSVLLTSSPFNKKITTPHLLSLQMLEEEPDPKEFQAQPLNVGVLLEGNFISNFKNRPLPEGMEGGFQVVEESTPAKMIVLSDGDLLKSQVNPSDGSVYPLGFDRYTQQSYGNKNFLLNAVDYLAGETELMTLRNKEINLRLLDRPQVRSEKLFWQVFNNLLPIGIILTFGIFQHYWRKRKYAH
jgi:ABC-2 type transport system permease protein